MKYKQRLTYIDLFRAFGIMCMVMGHVGAGSHFSHFIHAFHMPMFFFISGLFCQPVSSGFSLWSYSKKKARTLLLPYAYFGIVNIALYMIYYREIPNAEILIHLVWQNTLDLPIASALWFLSAMYIADILYHFLLKYVHSCTLQTVIVAIVSTFGTVAVPLFQYRLPWSLDAAFVGIGLMHIGQMLSQQKNRISSYLMNMPLGMTLFAGAILFILIMISPPINMRNGTYPNLITFWINALTASVLGINLCRYIDNSISDECSMGALIKSEISFVGTYSIIYLALNQAVILYVKRLISCFELRWSAGVILCFCISILALRLLGLAIVNSRIRFVIGK